MSNEYSTFLMALLYIGAITGLYNIYYTMRISVRQARILKSLQGRNDELLERVEALEKL